MAGMRPAAIKAGCVKCTNTKWKLWIRLREKPDKKLCGFLHTCLTVNGFMLSSVLKLFNLCEFNFFFPCSLFFLISINIIIIWDEKPVMKMNIWHDSKFGWVHFHPMLGNLEILIIDAWIQVEWIIYLYLQIWGGIICIMYCKYHLEWKWHEMYTCDSVWFVFGKRIISEQTEHHLIQIWMVFLWKHESFT